MRWLTNGQSAGCPWEDLSSTSTPINLVRSPNSLSTLLDAMFRNRPIWRLRRNCKKALCCCWEIYIECQFQRISNLSSSNRIPLQLLQLWRHEELDAENRVRKCSVWWTDAEYFSVCESSSSPSVERLFGRPAPLQYADRDAWENS